MDKNASDKRALAASATSFLAKAIDGGFARAYSGEPPATIDEPVAECQWLGDWQLGKVEFVDGAIRIEHESYAVHPIFAEVTINFIRLHSPDGKCHLQYLVGGGK